MFNKDTFRLVKKTANRFISLTLIVAIGVAFMMGLLATPPIMRSSVDRFNDEFNLQDIQLYSTYGFCDEDIEAIKELDEVEYYYGSKTFDCMSIYDETRTAVARLEELNRDVNKLNLLEGRWPANDKEAVLLVSSVADKSYQLNKKVRFYLEDDEISESLANDEYTIVGFVNCPAYISKVLGSSNYNNLDLSDIYYIYNENFIAKYYTTVYLTLDGSKELMSYTGKYEDFINEKLAGINSFATLQQEYNKEQIKSEIEEEINDGVETLESERAKAEKELADAKQLLEDGHVQLIYAQMQIDQMKEYVKQAKATIESQNKVIAKNEKSTNDKKAAVEKRTGQKFESYYRQLAADYANYTTLKTLVADSTINTAKESIDSLQKTNVSNQETIDNNSATIASNKVKIAELEKQLANETDTAKINEINTQITDLKNENTRLTNQNTALENSIETNNNAIKNLNDYSSDDYIASNKAQMAVLDKKYGGSIEKEFAEVSAINEDINALIFQKQAIETSNSTIASVNQMIADSEKEYKVGLKTYENGQKEYEDGLKKFNEEMEKAEAEIAKARQQLEDLPEAKWMVLDRSSHYSSYMYKNTCNQMNAIAISLPVLFYLVAALVCMTTMTRLIDEQRSQIGIFAALGFSKNQIAGKFVIYSLAASLIGGTIGLFVGVALFPTVIYSAWHLMYALPKMSIVMPIGLVILCIAAFAVLMMAVSYLVAMNSLKDNPAQLLRPKAPKNAKKVFVEHIHFIWNRLSFTSKITVRNLIRYKSRFFMTVIGVAGCTGLLVVGWGIKDSIAEIINIQFGEIFNYNYTINLDDDLNNQLIVDDLKADLDNEYVVQFMQYTSRAYFDDEDATFNAIVIDPRGANEVFSLRLTDRKTETRLTNNGVIVSEKFAKNNNIKKGDSITIESKNGVKKQASVSAICEMYFQHYIYISDSYYRMLFNESPVNTSIALATTHDRTSTINTLKQYESYNSLVDFSSMINQFQTMIEALDLIILVIIITAGSLAFVVLYNLTQVNISERVREIATLKVLGFNDHEVRSYIFKEIFLLSIIGALVGLPLGVVEHHFIMNIINMDMVMFGMRLTPQTFGYAFIITMLFTFIVLLFTKKQLKQIEMIESLKSVE